MFNRAKIAARKLWGRLQFARGSRAAHRHYSAKTREAFESRGLDVPEDLLDRPRGAHARGSR